MENDQEILDKLEDIYGNMADLKDEHKDTKAIIIALGVGFISVLFLVGIGISAKIGVWFVIGGTALSYFYDRQKRT